MLISLVLVLVFSLSFRLFQSLKDPYLLIHEYTLNIELCTSNNSQTKMWNSVPSKEWVVRNMCSFFFLDEIVLVDDNTKDERYVPSCTLCNYFEELTMNWMWKVGLNSFQNSFFSKVPLVLYWHLYVYFSKWGLHLENKNKCFLCSIMTKVIWKTVLWNENKTCVEL